MELSDNGFEVLLSHLTPADTAALRLVSRGWQALVDRCLTTLQPFEVTTGFFSLSSTPCLTYRSPFQHSSVQHHPLECGPSYALHAIAGQFTSLHTLSVDCASKACGDFEALGRMRHLRRLQLSQFSFADEAFARGLGLCHSLEVLHLHSQQAALCVLSLRHLSGLSQLQELVLRPRAYTQQPQEFSQGIAALGALTALTHLALLTALKPPRHTTSGEPSALAGPVPEAVPVPGAAGAGDGHSPYLTAAATLRLSEAICGLTSLKVLHLTSVAFLPPAIPRLTQLVELSLLRIARIDRAAVASLKALQQLSSLTVITAADAPDQQEPHQQQHAALAAVQPLQGQQDQQQQQGHEHIVPGPVAAAASAAAAAVAAAAAMAAAGQGLWLPLLEQPALQQLVLGSAHLSQQLNLSGDLTASLSSPQGRPANHTTGLACAGGSSEIQGAHSGTGWCGDGWWQQQACELVSAYVCPTGAWSDITAVKGLQHMVLVRSWHSAAVTAVFPSFAATVAAFMTWTPAPAATPAPARPVPSAAAAVPAAAARAAATAAAAAATSQAAAGAVGVFYNHPNQGCYMPSLPQLLVLAFRPCVGRLGAEQRALVGQVLQCVARQQGSSTGGGQLQPSPAHGLGGWRAGADSVARCLLLAQLRSSLHHSKLLLVLGASATHLTRLELTVDQSWPPAVLASLGQLERLTQLSVLKLDCGRQQPAAEMWDGLSRLVGLRWLCLKWLDRLPVAHLAPLTNLVALQLKNVDKPPGVAQLAEVLHGMPHLTALAIEGALLDADEDWLRDMAGLIRHGRWTSSWVEHILCREYHLRVLGSITQGSQKRISETLQLLQHSREPFTDRARCVRHRENARNQHTTAEVQQL